jgi:hypothetical protein
VKVREGLAPSDYKDPGWFNHPQGTVAYNMESGKLSGLGEPQRHSQSPAAPADREVKVIKPEAGEHQH